MHLNVFTRSSVFLSFSSSGWEAGLSQSVHPEQASSLLQGEHIKHSFTSTTRFNHELTEPHTCCLLHTGPWPGVKPRTFLLCDIMLIIIWKFPLELLMRKTCTLQFSAETASPLRNSSFSFITTTVTWGGGSKVTGHCHGQVRPVLSISD